MLILIFSSLTFSITSNASESIPMKKHKFELLGDANAAPALGLMAQPFNASTITGAWADSVTGPTMYLRGQYYISSLMGSTTSIPTNATVTLVQWNWNIANKPAGLIVYLCDTIGGCLNVSGYQSAGSEAFRGRSANAEYYFAFGVPGSGNISPVPFGMTNNIIVNWTSNN
ncbi:MULTISPECIES: flagellar protein FlhE [unclassified Endozoicomonas]|uniref:flagellar protein FlhE n=2 Tax=unclassified Endozoicomonas TaxID=2644528 RepID=UPI003BB5BADF